MRAEPLLDELRLRQGPERRSRGASNSRVDVDERNAVRGASSLRGSHRLALLLVAGRHRSRTWIAGGPRAARRALEALVPVLVVGDQPLRGVPERRGLEVAQPGGRLPVARDQSGLFEHLEVPRDGRLRDAERGRQLGDIGVTRRQPGEDRAAGRIGEGSEHDAQLVDGHSSLTGYKLSS